MSPRTKLLNVPLQEWANANVPAEELIWGNGYWQQIMFVRDKVLQLFCPSYEDYKKLAQDGLRVISIHTSKSVLLPVYEIALPDGTEFTLRYNFHDWKISVNSPTPVEYDFMDLFDPNEDIDSVYCEGFPSSRVYGSYANNTGEFTIALYDDYSVWTFFYLYTRKVLNIQANHA